MSGAGLAIPQEMMDSGHYGPLPQNASPTLRIHAPKFAYENWLQSPPESAAFAQLVALS
jgi:hypothetical protein